MQISLIIFYFSPIVMFLNSIVKFLVIDGLKILGSTFNHLGSRPKTLVSLPKRFSAMH